MHAPSPSHANENNARGLTCFFMTTEPSCIDRDRVCARASPQSTDVVVEYAVTLQPPASAPAGTAPTIVSHVCEHTGSPCLG
eukprot:COSAG02_NODE_4689_length_5091_cov_1.795072_4_plen_82_part_00